MIFEYNGESYDSELLKRQAWPQERAYIELLESRLQSNEALTLVIEERVRQNEKWGDQSGKHPFEWMSILGEEYGELCEAVNETCFGNSAHPERGGPDKIIKEAVHVAAVAVAIVEATLKQENVSET